MGYYFVDLSGETPGTAVELATHPSLNNAVLSPDGRRFAYVLTGKPFVVDVSGKTPSASVPVPGLDESALVSALRFSPDGHWLSFVAGTYENATIRDHELHVSDVSGATPGAAVKVSPPLVTGGNVVNDFQTAYQRFTPDSQHIVYAADADTDEVVELYLSDLGGAPDPRRVSSPLVEGGDVGDEVFFEVGYRLPFEISSDGRWVFYLADGFRDGDLELYGVDLSGGTPAPAIRLDGTLVFGGDVAGFVVAPDASGLAYVATQRSTQYDELFYIDLRGALPSAAQIVNPTLVLDGDVATSSGFHFDLSPDGRWLAYVADQLQDGRDDVFLVDVASGQPGDALLAQAQTNVSARPSHVRFAADSGTLVYLADAIDTHTDLWAVDVNVPPGAAQQLNDIEAEPVVNQPPQFLLLSR
jgi:Tol biopolymer transport system component